MASVVAWFCLSVGLSAKAKTTMFLVNHSVIALHLVKVKIIVKVKDMKMTKQFFKRDFATWAPIYLLFQFQERYACCTLLCRSSCYVLFLQLILNAKCHAIRDTQLLEKEIIKKEQRDEDKRLDHIMEIDRKNAIAVEEEIEKRRKDEKLVGAMKIMQQIEENEKVHD